VVAQGSRTARPSADHTSTQSRNLRDAATCWAAEAAKMRQVHGAPTAGPDAQAIVHCLVAACGG
jgi:hypothetical protein